jgi:hypothetical protein
MLEWLKTILGDQYTEDIDKKVSAEIGKGFVAKADFNTANEAKKTAEAQLAAASKTIYGYKTLDIDGIRASAEQYKADAAKAKQDADARVAAVQFDAALDGAITAAHGRSAKAIKALLDLDALKDSKDLSKDAPAALETLKKDNGYLFEPAAASLPYADGTGSAKIVTEPGADGVESKFAALNPGLKY